MDGFGYTERVAPYTTAHLTEQVDGPLADVSFRPSPNLWVLEIAIAHPDGTFGAFYEDLLLEDQSFPE